MVLNQEQNNNNHLNSNASLYTLATSNVFVGVTNNLYLQNASGNSRFRFNVSTQELNCFGDLTGFDNALASDLRLKNGVSETGVLESATSVIENLRPVTYKWIEHTDRPREAGFIAQEVASFAPDLVSYNNTHNAHAVRYTRIVPYLVRVIQSTLS